MGSEGWIPGTVLGRLVPDCGEEGKPWGRHTPSPSHRDDERRPRTGPTRLPKGTPLVPWSFPRLSLISFLSYSRSDAGPALYLPLDHNYFIRRRWSVSAPRNPQSTDPYLSSTIRPPLASYQSPVVGRCPVGTGEERRPSEEFTVGREGVLEGSPSRGPVWGLHLRLEDPESVRDGVVGLRVGTLDPWGPVPGLDGSTSSETPMSSGPRRPPGPPSTPTRPPPRTDSPSEIYGPGRGTDRRRCSGGRRSSRGSTSPRGRDFGLFVFNQGRRGMKKGSLWRVAFVRFPCRSRVRGVTGTGRVDSRTRTGTTRQRS